MQTTRLSYSLMLQVSDYFVETGTRSTSETHFRRFSSYSKLESESSKFSRVKKFNSRPPSFLSPEQLHLLPVNAPSVPVHVLKKTKQNCTSHFSRALMPGDVLAFTIK